MADARSMHWSEHGYIVLLCLSKDMGVEMRSCRWVCPGQQKHCPPSTQVLPSRAQPPTPCDAQWLVCTALTTWAHFYHTAIPSTWTVSKLHLIASCAIITILRRLDLFGLFSLDYQIKVYLISLSFEWLVSIYFWDDKHLLLKWGNVWVFHLFLESHGAALPGRVNLTALRSSQLLELSWQMVRERLTEGLAKHWAAPSKIAGVYPAK